ncbi:hypothetical protein MF406_12690 [Georgenia sp. TF02-10]|uniref:hypothetical protein n=1 Tax=Georgenia sp. TF02-10 TaxID=2917725 RepID=UPI001FA767E8|nr:hypothetical protein [Georgenia sp. TF02-10]UNX53831.1 hypothetical protein MF406_12690 [Georgenia sp. TF02-10]
MSRALHAEMVDPRYVNTEVDDPVYRVDFWSTTWPDSWPREDDVPDDARGLFTEEWRVTGARSVHEVVAWAETNGGGREYVLGVEFRYDAENVVLIRLAGQLPDE